MTAKHCFDAKCLDLAIYFYPAASADRLNDLAQRIQNEVESEDLDASAPETSPVQAVCDRAAHLADVPTPLKAEAGTARRCRCGQVAWEDGARRISCGDGSDHYVDLDCVSAENREVTR